MAITDRHRLQAGPGTQGYPEWVSWGMRGRGRAARGKVAGNTTPGRQGDRDVQGEQAIKVLIADDHPVVLSGVRGLLERTVPGIVILDQATHGRMLLECLERHPDCAIVVMDFSMPHADSRDCDGIHLIQTVRRRYPHLRIVVLTMIDNPALLHAVLDAGVKGLVGKAGSLDEVGQAVVAVAAGREYLSTEVRGTLEAAGPRREGEVPRLSPHEAEVVRLFAQGMTVTEIATHLSRSVKTISRQKSDAMRKLGLANNSQLYAYARDHGLCS
jgi:two-component system capsular synthesis response regulator RcsB